MKRIIPSLFISLFVLIAAAYGQTRVITGTVTDADTDEALIGVSVMVKGTAMGTITDIDGNYSLEVPQDNDVLIFSYVGCETQDVRIEGRSVIDVELSSQDYIVSEPVYFFYSETQKKRDVSTARSVAASRSAEFWLGRPNDIGMIQGLGSGFYVGNSSLSDNNKVTIRGGSSLTDGRVKYIVDGIADAPFVMSEVQTITVLKDAAAMSSIGMEQAPGGVMAVQTKNTPYAGGVSANAWVGVRTVDAMMPDDKSGGFGDFHKSGLVQHYDATVRKQYDNLRILFSASYDNAEDGIDAVRDERMAAHMKIDMDVTRWMNFGQHIFYNDHKNKYSMAAKDNSAYTLFTGHAPSERAMSASSVTIKPWQWLKLRSTFTYDKIDRDSDLGDILTLQSFRDRTKYHYDYYRRSWEHSLSFSEGWNGHNLMLFGGYKTTTTGVTRSVDASRFRRGDTFEMFMLQGSYNFGYGTRGVTASLHRLSAPFTGAKESEVYLPSVGVVWKPLDESFMRRHEINLKLFANWGKTASMGVDGLSGMQLYMIPFITDGTLGWQVAEQFSAGLDFGLFDNRVYGSVHYFDKHTSGMPQLVRTGSGILLTTAAGAIDTKGFEYYLGYRQRLSYRSDMELSANLTTYDITDRAVYSAGLYPGWGALDVPDYFYGFRLSFYWKNLYADILFRGAGDARFLTADMDYARVDYFGMKSLGVNYRIPLHRIFYGIPSGKDLIVYANAENLFTNVSSGFSTSEALAGYLNYPLYRLLSLGLKLNF